jgi:Family of unknown function (DUF6491)
MKKTILGLSGAALIAVLMGPSAVVAQISEREACLQNNRIWGWNVINERTLIVTDRNNRPFLVRLSGGCVGLTNATLRLRFNTWTNLGCLGRGDRVSFRAPALGSMTCFVNDVQPYLPGPNTQYFAQQDQRRYNPRDYDR